MIIPEYIKTLSTEQVLHLAKIYKNLDDVPSIPEGYRFLKFSVPSAGDYIIAQAGGHVTTAEHDWFLEDKNYRIILEKCSEIVYNQNVVVFQEDVYGTSSLELPHGYTFQRFGFPNGGEYFIGAGGCGSKREVLQQPVGTSWSKSSGPRLVVKKV